MPFYCEIQTEKISYKSCKNTEFPHNLTVQLRYGLTPPNILDVVSFSWHF